MRQDPPTEKDPSRRWHRLIVPGLLCLVYVAQGAWFIRTQSLTYDEPEHICAGLDALRYGEFRSHDDQPPLGRMFFALPMLSTDWKCVAAVNDTNAQPERPQRILLSVCLYSCRSSWRTSRWPRWMGQGR